MLAFPGVFRGLLDAASHSITVDMLSPRPGRSPPSCRADELNAAYIVPSVFHPDVATAVAAAVSKAVRGRRRPPRAPASLEPLHA